MVETVGGEKSRGQVRTDVEAGVHELAERLDIVGLGTNGADDRRLRVSDAYGGTKAQGP